MKPLNNLKIQHKCFECKLSSERFFCDLPQPDLQIFESLKITNAYPKDSTLFLEGEPSNGIYMLCQGRIKLSTCSRDGKVIILRIAEPGEVLGLSETVSDSPYKATAEVLSPCQVNFIRKDDFLRFLKQNPEACFSAMKHLSHKYYTAYSQIRSFGLSHNAADKLAKLMLEWCKNDGVVKSNGVSAGGGNGYGNSNGNGNGTSVHLKISYTHEEIAEMIGTSRETVTRLLKDFKDRKLITLKGSDLVIHDPKKLDMIFGI